MTTPTFGPPRLTPEQRAALAAKNANRKTLHTQARQALTDNRAFLANASPTQVQVLAQVRALTRQVNGLMRIALGQYDGTD